MSALTAKAARQTSGPRSAAGSRITETANPAPPARPSIATANARAPSGASSTTAMPPTTSAAFTLARTTSCAAVKTSMLGATAETRLPRHTPPTHQSRTIRRPRRSARAVATSAKRTPARVIASEIPSVGVRDPEAVGDRVDELAEQRRAEAGDRGRERDGRDERGLEGGERGGREEQRTPDRLRERSVLCRRGDRGGGVACGLSQRPLVRGTEEPLEEGDVQLVLDVHLDLGPGPVGRRGHPEIGLGRSVAYELIVERELASCGSDDDVVPRVDVDCRPAPHAWHATARSREPCELEVQDGAAVGG